MVPLVAKIFEIHLDRAAELLISQTAHFSLGKEITNAPRSWSLNYPLVLGKHQLSGLEEDLNQERDCLTRAKKDRDNLRTEVASLRQIQGFANRYGKRAGATWG